MHKRFRIFFLPFCALLAVAACKEQKPGQKKISTKAESPAKVDPWKYMFDQAADAEVLPVELIPFVYSPYAAYSFEESDLNFDGLKDYILVLAQPYQKAENGEDDLNSVPENSPAPVLVLLRQKDMTLRYHSKNEKLFTLEDLQAHVPIEVGIYADSLSNGFNLYSMTQGSGATASYSKVTYRFRFDKQSNKFYLAETMSEDGFVSPGGAEEFMLEKARQGTDGSGSSYDTTEIKEADYGPTFTSGKYKVGEVWFSNFRMAELEDLEEL